MIVYVVVWYDTGSDESSIQGVFTTKSKADAYIWPLSKEYVIEEFTLDAPHNPAPFELL